MISNTINAPYVCVCLPTYNSSKTVSETIESILAQTHKNFQLIVVDNASTDSTVEIVEHYMKKDLRVNIHKFTENVGAEGNFTRCFELAEGDYTAIYHADDVYELNILERQVAFLEQYMDAGAVFTSAVDIDENGVKGKVRKIPNELLNLDKELYNFNDIFKMVLKYGNFLICPSAMVRTNIYKEDIRVWNGKDYATSADLDVWLRILNKHSIGIINEPLINYRVSTSSFSYNYARSRTKRHDLFLVLDDYINGYGKDYVNSSDIKNYKQLLIKDNINRSISHLVNGDKVKAFKLMSDNISCENMINSLKSNAQSKYFIIGLITFFLCIFPIGKLGRKILYKLRYGKT